MALLHDGVTAALRRIVTLVKTNTLQINGSQALTDQQKIQAQTNMGLVNDTTNFAEYYRSKTGTIE